MSLPGIGFALSQTSTALQAGPQQRQADLRSLASALRSGDLAGAGQAFGALQQDVQAFTTAGPGRGQSQTNAPNADLKALEGALQNGDLGGAQKAFAALTQHIHTLHHAHRGHSRQTGAAGTSGRSGGGDATGTGTSGTLNLRV